MKRKGEGKVIIESMVDDITGNTDKYHKSIATRIKHSYPLKFLIPQYATDTNCSWIYPITYGGGLVSGDYIDIDIQVKRNCCAVVTSQESTKVFVSENDQVTEQICRFGIGDEALLCSLPDPVVCFKDGRFSQIQEVRMSATGNLVLLDLISPGRVARGENWQFLSLKNRLSVYIKGEHVLNEVNYFHDTPWRSMAQSMAGYEMIGTCVIMGDHLTHLVDNLHQKYGRQKQLGEKNEDCGIISISRLEHKVSNKLLTGCFLRFLTSTDQVYNIIDSIVQPLVPIIGSNPYANKH